ncbi:hypothetical protein V5T82_09245 [Magnetovibrio sp. PR-2]|uniref:hypothetical protein n=1 Tax=Magnetovibrio sp. PR-2 TaxID=3120356 RepID=UPI002FCE5811
MAKTAHKAVPQEDENRSEGYAHGPKEGPDGSAPRVETHSLRGTFAKSICRAHGLATLKQRAACEEGVPCEQLSECMDQADATVRYLDLRKRLLGTD